MSITKDSGHFTDRQSAGTRPWSSDKNDNLNAVTPFVGGAVKKRRKRQGTGWGIKRGFSLAGDKKQCQGEALCSQ